MTEEQKYPYLGISHDDGTTEIKGPLSEVVVDKTLKNTEKPVAVVKANKLGEAILRILTLKINSDNSQPKK